jgi:hypothetical protein
MEKKFIKKSGFVEMVNLTETDLLHILKLNIQCTLLFTRNNEVIDTIDLGDRLYEKGMGNCISIVSDNEANTVEYKTLLNIIAEKVTYGVLSVKIINKIFKQKESLLLMVGNLKENVVKSCIYIDYDKKNEYYLILNKSNNNLSNKIYYFDVNDSILAFNDKGPKLIFGKTQSVEDILCN